MTYPNSQGNPASSIPVWLDVQPAASGPYPNNKNVTGGAIAVYEVAAPANTPPFPNNQGTATSGVNAGAIPVRVVAKPSGAGSTSNDPSNDLAAIPVWVVSSATGKLPAYPNAQGNAHGAIPVYVVGQTPAQAAAAVFAKYPAGAVHVYLSSQAYTDAGGTTLATTGQAVVLMKDSQGTENAFQNTSPPSKAANGSVFFNSQFMTVADPAFAATDDQLVVTGFQPIGTSQFTMGVAALAARNQTSTFSRLCVPGVTSTTLVAMWTSDVPTDFTASFTNTDPYSTARVVTSRKVSNTGSLRVNGAVKSTVDLTTLGTVTVTQGYLGAQYANDQAPLNGNIYAVVSIKGVVTDADVLTVERWVNTLTPTGVSF